MIFELNTLDTVEPQTVLHAELLKEQLTRWRMTPCSCVLEKNVGFYMQYSKIKYEEWGGFTHKSRKDLIKKSVI